MVRPITDGDEAEDMHTDTLLAQIPSIVCGIAVIGWVVYRQTTWRRLEPARIWRAPAILAVAGIASIGSGLQGGVAADQVLPSIWITLITMFIAAATGVAMGAIAHFRPSEIPPRSRTRATPSALAAAFDTRTGGWGIALWAVVIAVRILVAVIEHRGTGTVGAFSTGGALLTIAMNRGARASVLLTRASRLAERDRSTRSTNDPAHASAGGTAVAQAPGTAGE